MTRIILSATSAVVSAVLSGHFRAQGNYCAKDSARYSITELPTAVLREIRESHDGASAGVALRFAAIFGAVRL